MHRQVFMVTGASRVLAVSVVVSLVLMSLALTGCSGSDNANGAPLAVPPDYALRPPRPGTLATQKPSLTQQPQDTVFRAGANRLGALPPAKSRSPGETALLYEAGAQNAPSNIRQLVNNDNHKAWSSATLTERLLTWHRPVATANAEPRPTIEPVKNASDKDFFGWL
jgi:hypothetical protein